MKQNDAQILSDTLLRQQDSIKVLCETIDKLTDKVLAKDLPEYKSLTDEVERDRTPQEKSPYVPLENIPAHEAFSALNDE